MEAVKIAKRLVWDTGPIITLALNNLLWSIPKLKEKFGGEFIIPHAVKYELIDRPLETKKYKLEALQVIPLLNDGTFKLMSSKDISLMTQQLMQEMNAIYSVQGKPIKIVHPGEIDAISVALLYDAQGIVVDERNTRYLIENPKLLMRRLQKKMHRQIEINEELLHNVHEKIKHIKVMRSAELLMVAFEHGIINDYLRGTRTKDKKELVEGLLWGAKLHGCGITYDEISLMLAMVK